MDTRATELAQRDRAKVAVEQREGHPTPEPVLSDEVSDRMEAKTRPAAEIAERLTEALAVA